MPTCISFFNEGAKPLEDETVLSSHGRKAERWDAQTGHIQPVAATRTAGHVRIPLRLHPYQTSFIVVR